MARDRQTDNLVERHTASRPSCHPVTCHSADFLHSSRTQVAALPAGLRQGAADHLLACWCSRPCWCCPSSTTPYPYPSYLPAGLRQGAAGRRAGADEEADRVGRDGPAMPLSYTSWDESLRWASSAAEWYATGRKLELHRLHRARGRSLVCWDSTLGPCCIR